MKNKWRNIIITTVVLVLKNIHSQFSSFCQLLINVSDLPEGNICRDATEGDGAIWQQSMCK